MIADDLAAVGELDLVGGIRFVFGLQDWAVTSSQWPVYAARVREEAAWRNLCRSYPDARELRRAGRTLEEAVAAMRAAADAAEAGAPVRQSRLIDDAALAAMEPPAWLVEEIIPEGGIAMAFGPPESAKTFLGIDLAASIGTGHRFHGRSVVRGPVVYVAAEGGPGLGVRVDAWRHARGHHGRIGVHFLLDLLPLLDAAAVSRFLTHDLAALPTPPRLVVLDTWAWMTVGADENSTEDSMRALESVRRIRDTTGAAVLIIHHSNRTSPRAERGSSALRGALDAMLSVELEDRTMVVRCEKMKDFARFLPLRFELRTCLRSSVLEGATTALHQTAEDLTPSARQALEDLHRLAPSAGLSASKWEDMSELKRRTFYDALKRLTAAGYVSADREGRGALYSVTDHGERALSAAVQVGAMNGADGSTLGACNPGGSYRDPPVAPTHRAPTAQAGGEEDPLEEVTS